MPAIAHGYKSLFLTTGDGQISETHSVSAGLDYPGVGPQLAELGRTGRVRFTTASDAEALDAVRQFARNEGVVMALESAHAGAVALAEARRRPADQHLVVNMSGRGDKDLFILARELDPARWREFLEREAASLAPAAEAAVPPAPDAAAPTAAAVPPAPHGAGGPVMSGRQEARIMTHLVASFPSWEASLEVGKGLVDGGAAYLEVQFPFSDPTADGPHIQVACDEALAAGFTQERGFALVAALRTYTDVPVAVMSYANPIFQNGVERFVQRCRDAGADAIIAPDLPPDYDEGLYAAGTAAGVAVIPVVVPSTLPERLEMVGHRRRHRLGVRGATQGHHRQLHRDRRRQPGVPAPHRRARRQADGGIRDPQKRTGSRAHALRRVRGGGHLVRRAAAP